MANIHDRLIGTYLGDESGPVIIFVGGIHGNEPAGVRALENVFNRLNDVQPPFSGKIVGLRGNRQALAVNKRFIDRDLNRLWSEEAISRIKSTPEENMNSEEKELAELIAAIESEFNGTFEPEIFIDLHTTSAPRGIFSIVSDEHFNVELASALHAPVLFRLTDSLTSTTNIFMGNRHLKGLAFESGQHADPKSVDNHEAAIWLILEKTGCLNGADIPGFFRYHEQLVKASSELPAYAEVVYRHEITDEDQYEMLPGFVNYAEVLEGEVLGKDQNGLVRAPMGGMILMPLYQPQGEEGFFIIQEIESPLF